VTTTARVSLKLRYAILKWYYSLFIQTNGRGSVFKPLMFEFPDENELYDKAYGEWEFLLGKSLLATPSVHPGELSVDAYFPKTNWYNFFTGEKVITQEEPNRVLNVKTPFDTPAPLFLRAGHIVHQQNVDNVLSTNDLNDELEFVVGFEKYDNGLLQAKGSFMGISSFTDDNVHDRCMEDNCLYDIKVTGDKDFESNYRLEVQFNAQKQNTKVPLDDIGVKGFKLYGLPLEFLEEDEKKIGYTMVSLTSAFDGSVTIPDIQRVVLGEDGAISLSFASVYRINDGYKLSFEILV